MELYLEVIVMLYLTGLGSCDVEYNYEKLHRYGVGNRIIPNFRRSFQFQQNNEHPEPLPSSSPRGFVKDPYEKISQGKRVDQDVRVYKKSFTYPATMDGHKIVCDYMLDCKITYLTINTDRGIPIILRGGAGYYYFTIVVRARAGDPLDGTITAYCVKNENADDWKIDPPKKVDNT